MGKIAPSVFRDWKDGETVNALDYKQEREILRVAVNDTHDRYLADEATIQQELTRLEAFGYEGVYDPLVTYGTNAFVSYDNALWVALQPTTGITPVEGANWEVLLTVKVPIENAELATTNANTAASTATTQGNTAETQGNVTETQGVTAESQGNTAQVQGSTAQTSGEYAETQGDYALAQGDYASNAQHLGEYDPLVAYVPLNQVSLNGSSYIAIAETTGNAPTNTLYWELSAQRGVDGTGAVSSVNDISPDGVGNVTLGPGDVGSEPSFTKKTGFNKDLGTITGTVAEGSYAKSISDNLASHQGDEVSQGEVHGMRMNQATKAFEYYDGVEWKTVSGGLPVGSVTNFEASSGNAQATITWVDPTDVTLDGATLAAWKGTKLLRKTTGYPTNENDGVQIVDSGVRDQYSIDGFIDTGLTNDTTYYYSAFPYTDEDIYDKKSDAQATPQASVVYGVKIDKTNSNPETAVTYTDMAVGFTSALGNNGAFSYGSWQDKFPFNQIKPCLYLNGAVNYYLDPNDYSLKEDGVTASDISSGADGDVMIEFPKIWWKFETVGTDLFVRYSDTQYDVDYKPLAHTKGATEKDFVYISAYLGHTLGGALRSLSGKTPTATKTIGAFRTEAQAVGANFEQMAYYQLLMTQVLYLVMFKNRDSQTALGRGFVDGNSAATNTGGTDAKGMFYGETTGKLQMKFCGIEDWFGNLRYWIDGFFSDANYNMLIGTENFNDTGSGYTNHGQGATANLGGYISDVQGGTETGFVVKADAGSATTHYADYGNLYASRVPYFGGDWANADIAGAFFLSVAYDAAYSNSYLGARTRAL